jgi:hypothetical protein
MRDRMRRGYNYFLVRSHVRSGAFKVDFSTGVIIHHDITKHVKRRWSANEVPVRFPVVILDAAAFERALHTALQAVLSTTMVLTTPSIAQACSHGKCGQVGVGPALHVGMSISSKALGRRTGLSVSSRRGMWQHANPQPLR